jgi:hypothetical protein
LGALPEAVHADIAGADAPVADPDAKRRLRDATGATAVDMESHVAARIAADYDIPLAACRVVIDPVHRRLPPAALVGLKPKGTVDFLAVLRSIAQRPSQLPALLGIAFEARAAQAALVRGRRLLGARLGFPQPGELRPRGTSCSMVYPGAWQPFRSANPFRGPAINA